MTSPAYRARLWLYIAAAVIGFMVGNLNLLHLEPILRDRMGFGLGAILAGVVIVRAFIDTTAGQAKPTPPPTPSDPTPP